MSIIPVNKIVKYILTCSFIFLQDYLRTHQSNAGSFKCSIKAVHYLHTRFIWAQLISLPVLSIPPPSLKSRLLKEQISFRWVLPLKDNLGSSAGKGTCVRNPPPPSMNLSLFLVLHLLILRRATPPRLVLTAMRIDMASPQALSKQQPARQFRPRGGEEEKKKRARGISC